MEAVSLGNADAYTEAFIPYFVKKNGGLDDFTIDDEAKTVTITYNMNKVLVEHARAAEVMPFE